PGPDVNRGNRPDNPDRAREAERNPSAQPPSAREERPEQGWSHPLAKPAPPVQERTPQKQQQEEQKYNDWRQRAPQPSRPPAQPANPPSRSNPPQRGDDKPHK